MVAVIRNIVGWGGSRTEEGHREYTVKVLVQSSVTDGPQVATLAPGLPAIGDPWTFGNDNDPWAFCTPFLKITSKIENEVNDHWLIDYKFTTRPQSRCAVEGINNPLLEPDKISGTFVSGSTQATKTDKDDTLIQTSSFEPVLVEFDKNLPTVVIEQNKLDLDLDVFAPMVNTLNNAVLWGLATRKVKLDNVSWDRKLHGICTFYYTKRYEFSINPDTFDRDDIPNRGKKQIHGEWTDGVYAATDIDSKPPDIDDATHYIRATDKNENLVDTFLVAATGLPSDVPTYLENVQHYAESNFLTLGIPSSLTT